MLNQGDFWINFLKYISIAIGSISGIIGLYIDLRDKKTGKILPRGYSVLGLIIVAGIVAVLLQSMELSKEKAANDENERKYQKQTKTTNDILLNINRTLNPIKDVMVTLEISHPEDSVLHPYIRRIEKALPYIRKKGRLDNCYFYTYNRPGDDSLLDIDPKSRFVPALTNESKARFVLSYERVGVAFIKDFDLKQYLRPNPKNTNVIYAFPIDLYFDIDLDLDAKLKEIPSTEFAYDPKTKEFNLGSLTRQVDNTSYFVHSSKLLSTLDLPGTTLVISFSVGQFYTIGTRSAKDSLPKKESDYINAIKASLGRYKIKTLAIEIDHKNYPIPPEQLIRIPDDEWGPRFTYRFPVLKK